MDINNPDNAENHGDEPDELNERVHDPGDPDGLIAAENERKWQESQPAPSPPESPIPKRKHPWLVALIVLVLIAAATVGAYYIGTYKANLPAKKATTTHTKTKQSTPAVTTVTKHYDSTIYTLAFDYPQDWVVSDTDAKLTITSPALAMTDQSGATTGHVVVTIQNKLAAIPGYPAQGTVANLASDKLTYKQPTSIQRAQTYLSYVGYSGPATLNALYITGDSGYQLGQGVPMSDVVKGNPLISVMFAKCTSSDCATGTPTPITLEAKSWDKAAFKPAIINLLQSLALN